MTDALNSRVARFETNEANVDAWAKGGPSTSVDFGGGPVRSPAKLISDNDAAINAAGLLGQVNQSKQDAQNAAASAAASANLVQSIQAATGPYPSSGATTVPSGVAASAMYWVINATTGGLDLYKNNAGTPQAQGVSIATQVALTAMLASVNSSASKAAVMKTRPFTKLIWASADVGGNMGEWTARSGDMGTMLNSEQALVNASLTLQTSATATKITNAVSRPFSNLIRADVDANRRICNALLRSSGVQAGAGAVASTVLEPLAAAYRATIATPPPLATMFIVPHVGQSLSIGTVGTVGGGPLTTTPAYNNVMLNNGVIRPDTSTSLLPAVEASNVTLGCAETGAVAFGQLVCAQDPQFKFCHMAVGTGGQTLYQLLTVPANWSIVLNSIQSAYTLAVAAGEIPIVPGAFMIHGENDEAAGTQFEDYISYAIQYADKIDAAVKSITGQTQRVMMWLSQPSSHSGSSGKPFPTISLAMNELEKRYPDKFRVIAPKYNLHYFDGYHVYNYDYRRMAHDFAKFFLYEYSTGKRWYALKPSRVRYASGGVIAEFPVLGSGLAFDTTLVTNPGNYGFELFDSAGSVGISSVSIVGANRVYVKPARAIISSPRLRYAYTGIIGNSPGWNSGPRGNLRRTSTMPTPFTNASGAAYDTYDWCCHFDEAVTIA